jgi:Leucine-rich repeat (LRR) protein
MQLNTPTGRCVKSMLMRVGLGRLPQLNTLVVKGNKISNFGTSLHGCTSLVKLSAAHNDIRELGNRLKSCTLLAVRNPIFFCTSASFLTPSRK